MKIRMISACAVVLLLLIQAVSAAAVDFPGRRNPKYKDVQCIEINQLYQDYLNGNVNIVDVRSKLEYETIHPVGAVHIPVAAASFESELKKFVHGSGTDKKIAFY